jgi:general secretion pathway protein K
MSKSREDGMILIVVLWVVAMMTVIVVALGAFARQSLSQAGVEADRLRTEMALAAGVDVGKATILARRPEDRAYFDGAPALVEIGGGRTIEVAVRDAAGLVDINRADQELMENLAARLDPSGEGAAAIVEAIVGRRQARLDAAAEKAGLQQPGKVDETGEAAPAPATAEFISTAQLLGLPGSDPAGLNKLLPFITVYSTDGKVNPLAAPEAILESIPGLTDAEAQTLRDARRRRQLKVVAVQDILSRHAQYIAVGETKVFIIAVTAVSGRGLVAGSRLEAIVIRDEAGAEPFQILAWSW